MLAKNKIKKKLNELSDDGNKRKIAKYQKNNLQ